MRISDGGTEGSSFLRKNWNFLIVFIAMAAFPTHHDELLAQEMLAEPIEVIGFGISTGQPIFDVVLHRLHGLPSAAHGEGHAEEHDHQDEQSVTGEERLLHGNPVLLRCPTRFESPNP